ncbi:MAG: hypothetical protein Q9184_006889 [Pyrenodesmia sp. 2 TL-2023]
MFLRKLFLRYLSLPHYRHLTGMPTFSPANGGRPHLSRARVYPWYTLPTFKKRLRGDLLPGDDEKFMPEGFETTRLGPVELMDKGRDKMVADAERLV